MNNKNFLFQSQKKKKKISMLLSYALWRLFLSTYWMRGGGGMKTTEEWRTSIFSVINHFFFFLMLNLFKYKAIIFFDSFWKLFKKIYKEIIILYKFLTYHYFIYITNIALFFLCNLFYATEISHVHLQRDFILHNTNKRF